MSRLSSHDDARAAIWPMRIAGLEYPLRNIEPDRASLAHGRLPWWLLNTTTLAHRCRRGASTPSRSPRMGSGQWSSVSALPVAVQRRILLGRHVATELPVIPGRRLGTGVAAFGGLGLLGPVGLAVF